MVVLTNIIVILMISSKLAAVGVLEIKLFRNKNYDVIISVHDVTKKILLSDPIYIEDIAVLWPIFGNSSISLREVIITSILSVFDKQNKFFWGVLLVQVQWFGTSTRKGLEILHQPKLTINLAAMISAWSVEHAVSNIPVRLLAVLGIGGTIIKWK